MVKNVNIDDFILRYKPIQRFVEGVGDRVLKYIGKDKAVVVGLGDDGVFYGEGLYVWLKKRGVDLVFTTMDYDCSGLDETKVYGRKMIVVDNDIITGTAYKSVMEIMKPRQKDLKFKDIKFAVLCDRTRLADFSVDDYVTTAGAEMVKLDNVDFKILQILTKNGRSSLAEIAEKTDLTVSGVKKRFEKLVNDGVLDTRNFVNIDKFYSISAIIRMEVETARLPVVIDRMKKSQMVFLLVKVFDMRNLMVGIVATSLGQINEFVEKNTGNDPGIRNVLISVGEIPLAPRSK